MKGQHALVWKKQMKTILFILLTSFLTLVNAEMHHHMDSMHQHEAHQMKHVMSTTDRAELSFPAACDAQIQACFLTTRWNGKEISLSASFSSKIKALRPFVLKLNVQGIDPHALEQVKASYSMPGMAMGKNEVIFVPLQAKTKDESLVFEAKSLVPMCPSGDVKWNVTIDLQAKNNQHLSVKLPFTLSH